MIYREGYYLQWDEDAALDVSQNLSILKIELSDEEIIDSVEYCISLDLFSKDMYDKHKILTSVAIQGNYQYACAQNKRKDGVTDFSLLPPSSPEKSKGGSLLGANQEETNDDSEGITIYSEEIPINTVETRVSTNYSNSNSNINININNQSDINNDSNSSISPEVQQRQDFNLLIQFFKMNYKSPSKELQKCREWYEGNEGHWADKSQAWRMYRVTKWEQKPSQDPRFEQKFVDLWLKVISVLKDNNAPLDVLFEAVGNQLWYRFETTDNNETIMVLRCSCELRDELEKNIKVVNWFVHKMGASQLRYSLTNDNNTNTPAPVVEDLP